MPYIGTSPSNGVRRVHTYTATASQTTFTGASSEGVTLSYADTNYIDVFQNGVLLGSADYTSTSGTSVVLAQGASADDLVVIVVYDVFSVADTVSKTNGGSFDSAVTMSDNLTVSGAFTSQGIDDNADGTAITIDSSEKVGIGTSSPSQLLDVVGSSANIRVAESSGGDLRINVSGSTGGIGTHSNHPLLFRTNSAVCMQIHSNGKITQGTTAIDGTGGITFAPNADGDTAHLRWNKATSSSTGAVIFNHNGSFKGGISYSSSGVTFSTSSDYRIKENVEDMTGAIDRVKQLSPKRFNFIADDTNTLVDGFLAHEAQSVVAEAVTGTHNEVDDDDNPVMQGIDQSKIVPLLTGALKEAITKIEALEARITALENAE